MYTTFFVTHQIPEKLYQFAPPNKSIFLLRYLMLYNYVAIADSNTQYLPMDSNFLH